ncbi:hypothetical protein BO71DRAFT_411837 [Aspergillus ellipticus CBS 707.79]|uniref:Tyrosine specific protein phosphatases domain-containing protein n=1 Tax=Aspergillus ellipticus CBS 707.79 TaxID=1448320 RepID=A0A319DJM6_9EURO|nr:hypothetical protein BO71DRAFT_411837 [Aspergillus ellipticus CBS 707.79]
MAPAANPTSSVAQAEGCPKYLLHYNIALVPNIILPHLTMMSTMASQHLYTYASISSLSGAFLLYMIYRIYVPKITEQKHEPSPKHAFWPLPFQFLFQFMINTDQISALPVLDSPLPPPFIDIPGVSNFRSLAGYPIPNSTQKTRQNHVYRSANLAALTPEGYDRMHDLGITKIFDLTSASEDSVHDDAQPTQQKLRQWVQRAPLDEERFSAKALFQKYEKLRLDGKEGEGVQLMKRGKESIREVFLSVRDHPDEKILIQCTLGKDRTGVVCALFLAVVGVEDQVIAKDYALSTLGLESLVPKVIRFVKRYGAKGEGGAGEVARRIVNAREDAMLATLRAIKEQFSGARQYLVDFCGFSETDVEVIRGNLVE